MRRKLSCTVIALNEEDRIARCLRSVHGVADEIIVVDSGSVDKTLEICASLGAKCLHNDWVGYGQQKRFAEDAACNDWILNLDADEWLTEEARDEIKRLFDSDEQDGIYGYKFIIKQVYPGAETPRLFADYHKYIRLYNKTLCRFPDSAVFDEIHINKENTGFIKGLIFHQSIRSIPHLIDKNVRYYKLQVKEVNKGRALSILRMPFELIGMFTKYYVFKRHFTGGMYGLAVASTIAFLRTYRLFIVSFTRKGK